MTRLNRSREAAVVIPAFGLFLLLPPIMSLFDTPSTLMGIPILHIYVFSVWLGLVIAGFWLSRRLAQDAETTPEADPPNDTG